jgi:hypothetical protein
LDIGRLSIGWSKNSRGNNHGPLFQEGDRKPVRSEQIDYDYLAEIGEDIRSGRRGQPREGFDDLRGWGRKHRHFTLESSPTAIGHKWAYNMG